MSLEGERKYKLPDILKVAGRALKRPILVYLLLKGYLVNTIFYHILGLGPIPRLFSVGIAALIIIIIPAAITISPAANAQIISASTSTYSLSIDTISVYPGNMAIVNINLKNTVPASGFDILFNYDVTALTLASVSKTGTRSSAFEYFTYQLDNGGFPGDVHVEGISDIDFSTTPGNLPAGDGPIIKLLFYATNDQSFGGFSVPVRFVFLDLFNRKDNTLFDTTGLRISQDSIVYSDGYVSILQAVASSLGDINLNGIPYEIGDAIYFTNYFINPGGYPLEPIQIANSDVNQDGHPASIADLVYLIVRLVNLGKANSKLRYDEESRVIIAIDSANGKYSLNYKSPIEMGGMRITLRSPENVRNDLMLQSQMRDAGMNCEWQSDGDIIRLLIYSKTGSVMPAGKNNFFVIENSADFIIDEIELSTTDGQLLAAVIKDDTQSFLPDRFELYQNYPNPFNPSTTISFDMPKSSTVSLIIFDLLGRNVKTLFSGRLGAGYHEFIWNGRDNSGEAVSSGIYLYELKTDDYSAQKKMLFIK